MTKNTLPQINPRPFFTDLCDAKKSGKRKPAKKSSKSDESDEGLSEEEYGKVVVDAAAKAFDSPDFSIEVSTEPSGQDLSDLQEDVTAEIIALAEEAGEVVSSVEVVVNQEGLQLNFSTNIELE